MTDDEVADIVNKLLDVGYYDASETVDDQDLDDQAHIEAAQVVGLMFNDQCCSLLPHGEQLYLICLHSGIEPELEGPFADEKTRLDRALVFRDDDDENLAIMLDLVDGLPVVDSYKGGDFDHEGEI